jgi:type IV pilus assembly protein PilP
MMSLKLGLAFVACAAIALAACGDDPVGGAPTAGKPGAAKAAPGAKAKPGTPAAAPSDLPPLPVREFHPRDFDESELSRDPFRSFEEMFRAQQQRKSVVQREVLAPKYSLDQLRIIGLVGGSSARVMMSDPSGFGWVMKVGDFVGQPEVVRTGGPGGNEVAVNWRLDRIRPNDAVFIREDPTRPDVPATTRVVSLRSEAELNPEIRTGIRGAGNTPPALGEAPPPLGASPGTPINPQAPRPAPAPAPAPPPPKPTG